MTALVTLLAALPALAQDGSAPWLTSQAATGGARDSKPAWAGATAAPAPSAAPWLGGGVQGTSARKPKLDLELEWSWDRLRGDLELLGRARSGLEREVRDLLKRRRRLVIKDPRTGELLPEYQAEAASLWKRVVDRLLALDSVVLRYRRFEELQDPELRAGAFVAAFGAAAAWSRFAREWTAAAADPSFVKPLDAPVPELGLKGGSFSSVRKALRSPERTQALSDAMLYADSGPGPGIARGRARSNAPGTASEENALRPGELRLEGARGLRKTGPAAAFALSWLKADVRDVRSSRAKARAERVVPVPAFEPWQRPVTQAGVWTGEALDQRAAAAKAAEPAGWGGSAAPFSQPWFKIGLATATAETEEESALHWLVRSLVERSTATRPAALVTPEQFALLNERLEPGDILLLRRENCIEEPGLGGWWTGAAVYVGTPEERERFTGSTALDAEINQSAGDAYWESIKTEAGYSKRVIIASPAGIRPASLERGAAADSVAAIRPRLPKAARARAALRAFQAAGRPYDEAFDLSDPGALYSMELILWAYAETPLTLEPRPASAQGPAEPSDIARTFDGQFGTSQESLDFIRFLDGQEETLRAARHAPEQFRLSWKRPRWRFEDAARAKEDEYAGRGAIAPAGVGTGAGAQAPIPDAAPPDGGGALGWEAPAPEAAPAESPALER